MWPCILLSGGDKVRFQMSRRKHLEGFATTSSEHLLTDTTISAWQDTPPGEIGATEAYDPHCRGGEPSLSREILPNIDDLLVLNALDRKRGWH